MGSVSAAHMLSIIFLVVLCCVPFSSARDSLTTGNWIEDDGSTLVSMNGTFELGFFTPNGSFSKGRYVGIWYHKLKEKPVVWVANRDQPLNAKSARFGIPPDGKLKAWDDNQVVLLYPGEESGVRVVKLMDSGNLVLRVNESGKNLWESFHNPTYTFLPEMKMDENLSLTSWVSPVDPAPGNYVFKQKNENLLTIFQNQNSSNMYWTSEKSWQIPHYIYAFLYYSSEPSNQNLTFEAVPSRLVMNFTGEITYLKWDNRKEEWSEIWLARGDRCSVYNACGNFGTCNVNNAIMCKCLPGFVPIEQEKWNAEVFSGGCDNKSPQCGDTFLNLKMIKVGNYDMLGEEGKNCREECSKHCCKAYAEVAPKCWIWSGNLPSLQEEDRDGYNLFVRVLRSDLESTTRNCETCGTNMIPYPLSTGPKCGDPEYFRFNCDNDTGQVSFKVIDSSYRVSSIDPKALKFVIQVKDANCSSPSLIRQIPKLKSPFSMTGVCNASKTDKFSSNSKTTLNSSVEIEISWDPPPEPECTLSADCKDWPNSNCTTRRGRRKCFCNENFKWNGQSLNCTQEHGNQKSLEIVVGISVAVALVALLCTLGCIAYLLNRSITKRTENRANWGRHLYASDSRVKHLIDSEQFKEEDKKGIDVPFFHLEDILAATDDFSDANKLGQGGFGPVYKGKFSKGQEMAIKRLSRASGQGLQEFKNEVVLIAKLQHRNLVRLLGYCVEGDEKILLYEYMANKSLDSFIFGLSLNLP
ncbi:hypothetical protein VitviT2T_018023 [Vitis vinifera]|uniref:Receptor-like serine/threonine-protein kinase n=1 Tax=Vitis vinifera TaxID=29760 RepID=A0ABY9CYK0_VITVI|nr:hypothetical protein VitviT2T_018023 [Vitis vinifera]